MSGVTASTGWAGSWRTSVAVFENRSNHRADDDQRRDRRARRDTHSGKPLTTRLMPSLDQPLHVEIDQQADFTAGEPQVRQHLGAVHRLESLDRLDFDDHRVFDEQIDSVAAVERLTSVDQRKRLLSFDVQPTVEQFEGEARFVRRFEQARAELAMNRDRRADDLVGQRVQTFLLDMRRQHAISRGQRDALRNLSSASRLTRWMRAVSALCELCEFCVYCRSRSSRAVKRAAVRSRNACQFATQLLDRIAAELLDRARRRARSRPSLRRRRRRRGRRRRRCARSPPGSPSSSSDRPSAAASSASRSASCSR